MTQPHQTYPAHGADLRPLAPPHAFMNAEHQNAIAMAEDPASRQDLSFTPTQGRSVLPKALRTGRIALDTVRIAWPFMEV